MGHIRDQRGEINSFAMPGAYIVCIGFHLIPGMIRVVIIVLDGDIDIHGLTPGRTVRDEQT